MIGSLSPAVPSLALAAVLGLASLFRGLIGERQLIGLEHVLCDVVSLLRSRPGIVPQLSLVLLLQLYVYLVLVCPQHIALERLRRRALLVLMVRLVS